MSSQASSRVVGPRTGTGQRVLIVGAGIAGLAVARALAGWGAQLEIVERTSEPDPGGAGIFLPANGVRGLRALGLEAPVAENAVAIGTHRVADSRGRGLYQVDTADLWRGIAPTLATSRATLRTVMLEHVEDVPIRWATRPVSINTRAGEGAEVAFGDGTTGRYDLVIGADGVQSAVRRMLFGEDGLRDTGIHAWRLIAPRGEQGPVWSARLGRGSAFLKVPISADQAYCYIDVSTDQVTAGLDGVETRFKTALPELRSGNLVHGGPLREVVLPRWSKGHVLLIGDAAHATRPNMAQGAAMAIEDALVLADVLQAGSSVPDAVREYEKRRRPRIEWVQEQSAARDRTRNMAPGLREVALRAVGKRMFEANYGQLHTEP